MAITKMNYNVYNRKMNFVLNVESGVLSVLSTKYICAETDLKSRYDNGILPSVQWLIITRILMMIM